MDRASDSGSEGWGFESLPVYDKEEWHSHSSLSYTGRDSKGRPERSEGANSPVDCLQAVGESPPV